MPLDHQMKTMDVNANSMYGPALIARNILENAPMFALIASGHSPTNVTLV